MNVTSVSSASVQPGSPLLCWLSCSGLLLSLLLAGCATGEKAYQKGRYQEAVQQAVKRLKSDPDNEKAIRVLQTAYPEAERWHLENIQIATESNAPLRWESVMTSYAQLNQLADLIRSAPAARRLFPNPRRYNTEMEEAAEKAAEVRYQMGVELLLARDRAKARRALDQFERANRLVPGYEDVALKIEEAERLATLTVVINPTTGAGGSLDVAFFENQMHEFISSYRPSRFVRFYTAEEARNLGITEPDQIIQLAFAPFPIGEIKRREKEATFRKKDVLIGRTSTNPPQEVFGTVKAEVTTFSLSVEASAQLDMKILDAQTGKVIRQRRIPGTSTWETSWATYQGDERAIPDEIKPLMKKRAEAPPSPQALFEHTAGGIYQVAAEEIRKVYNRM